MNDLVSIVIPIYKVEKYVNRCVDSVLAQTYPNLEIILVDDGSPDQCPQICDKYKEEHDNIQVVHKQNGGLASARNAGMKEATGKYLYFLDSDDWIEPQTIKELHEIAERESVDFVRFRPMYAGWPNHKDGDVYDVGIDRGMQEGRYDRTRIEKEILPRAIVTKDLRQGPILSACGSFFRRQFLEDNELWFYEDVRYGEDSIFSARMVSCADSFYYLDGPRYYHYFFNGSSISKSFHKDEWKNNKCLMAHFMEDFGDRSEFDFDKQAWRIQIFFVLDALSQRKALSNKKEQKTYIDSVIKDNVTVEAMKHLKLVDVPWKLYVILLLIKFKQGWILARV